MTGKLEKKPSKKLVIRTNERKSEEASGNKMVEDKIKITDKI